MSTAQGAFSEYVSNKELDLWFGATAVTAPSTLYIGLSTALSYHHSGVIVEPSGGSYARVASTNNATNWPAAASRIKRNGVALIFPAPTGAWGSVRSWFIADDPSAGNILASGSLPTPITIAGGDPAPEFAAGTLTFGK